MSAEAVLPVLRSQMSNMKIPRASDKVYKDECLLSFDSPFSDTGLYVNIVSYRGYGKDYLQHDIQKCGGKVYLHQKWQQVPKPPDQTAADGVAATAPNKLAIGVEGGFITEAKYDIIKEHALVVVLPDNSLTSLPLPDAHIPEFITNVVQGIIDHEGMKSNMQVSSWDADNEKFVSKYAADLVQLNPTGKKVPQDPKEWRDEASGATENLWLNLSTGYIGGGRKNWDGSGGSGSALDHYANTGKQYPLAVKLGTITPHGADVWCYAEDEDALVIDPKLAEHLSFWGIDIMKLEKTEKTVGEMEVSLNMSYDWTKIMDGQEELELLSGPGYVGLRNIGSSCYMNSVMQTFLAIPEVQERYYHQHEAIVSSVMAAGGGDAATDFPAQLSKLAVGVLSSKYVPPPSTAATTASTATATLGEDGGKDSAVLEKYVVAPRMFKHLVGQGHPEFSSGRQQDVSEYFQYFLECLNKAERVHLQRVIGTAPATGSTAAASTTASLFEFHSEIRYQCPVSGDVKYEQQGQKTLFNLLDLFVPRDLAVPLPAAEDAEAAAGAVKRPRVDEAAAATAAATEVETYIPFSACLDRYFAPDTVDLFSPSAGRLTACTKTVKFKTFPRYLMVKVARYYAGANWVQQKITSKIDVPEVLDLTPYRGQGPQEQEHMMPEEDTAAPAAAAAAAASTAVEFQVSEELVGQLVSMGFSENGSRRAAIATNNADADTAMSWVFAHMEDPDFNDPPPPAATASAGQEEAGGGGGGGGVNEEAVMMLSSMGYTTEQTTAALLATDNSIER